MMGNALFDNAERVFLTDAGARRIGARLGMDTGEVGRWCRRWVEDPDTLTRTDSRWHVRGDGFVIAIDAESYAVVSVRRDKPKKGSNLDDVGIIQKIDDIPALKRDLIRAFDAKTHRRVSGYGLLLADHILQTTGMRACEAIQACYDVNRRWQDGGATFQQARDVAGGVFDLARGEKDLIRGTALRVIGQVAAIPHVKRHALIASDYAVKVANLLHPGNLDAVKEERALQIGLMERV